MRQIYPWISDERIITSDTMNLVTRQGKIWLKFHLPVASTAAITIEFN
jgi:hypothetical protein